MSYALSAMSDEDAIEFLTALRDLEKKPGMTRIAVAEVITLIGNMGFQINRPDDRAEPETHNVSDVLNAIREQTVMLPRGGR